MSKKDVTDIPDMFLDAFGEDEEKRAQQLKEELREEINQKLRRLPSEKIRKQLLHLMKLLDVAW